MRNLDTTRKRGWIQVPVKGKQPLPPTRHLPCYILVLFSQCCDFKWLMVEEGSVHTCRTSPELKLVLLRNLHKVWWQKTNCWQKGHIVNKNTHCSPKIKKIHIADKNTHCWQNTHCRPKNTHWWQKCTLLTASSVVDCGFEPWSDQTKNYKIGICCLSAKHAALRRKSKDWLAGNQVNVSKPGHMSICCFSELAL